jgi:hypothetical protein
MMDKELIFVDGWRTITLPSMPFLRMKMEIRNMMG